MATKVISVATSAVGEAGGVLSTAMAKTADLGKTELHVGTQSISLHILGNDFDWSPGHDLGNIPDVPYLQTSLDGIKEKLTTLASISLQWTVVCWLVLLFLSSSICLGVAALGKRAGLFLALSIALLLNAVACISAWLLYWVLNLVLDLGRKVFPVERGTAFQNVWMSCWFSTAQLAISTAACFVYKQISRKTEQSERSAFDAKSPSKLPEDHSMAMATTGMSCSRRSSSYSSVTFADGGRTAV